MQAPRTEGDARQGDYLPDRVRLRISSVPDKEHFHSLDVFQVSDCYNLQQINI